MKPGLYNREIIFNNEEQKTAGNMTVIGDELEKRKQNNRVDDSASDLYQFGLWRVCLPLFLEYFHNHFILVLKDPCCFVLISQISVKNVVIC